VTGIVKHYGYKVHSIEGEERVVIGVVGVGDVHPRAWNRWKRVPQVGESWCASPAPYKFVSKEFRPGKTRIKVKRRGNRRRRVCHDRRGRAPSKAKTRSCAPAEAVAKAGAKFLRAAARFKTAPPSPYDFQGMEEEGLKLPAKKQRKATGLAIVTEVMGEPRRGSGGAIRPT